ncbi:MAG: anhydro-N-acetylmuramic acid kinase [Betaproteobacteria bacterium]
MAGELFIGLMSGTSLDGVDVALVTFNEGQSNEVPAPNVLATHLLAYPQTLRSQILALQHPTENELEVTALTGNMLAILYADAVHQLLANMQISPDKITAIGCHGQTIRHRPEMQFTLQIGNAALLAELTNITVVADFRSRDIAAAGQGAPLVPAFHQAIFANQLESRAIINIGGIANITYLSKNNSVIGFDSGPGNMLLDAWIKQHMGLDFDADGAWASTGKVIAPLLSAMLAEPYFASPPPKSTGRDLFNDAWLTKKLSGENYQPQDVARTLLELTAQSIYNALLVDCGEVDSAYLCGGGARNTLLKIRLQAMLAPTKLDITDALGIGADWVEAIAFAWLAKQCIQQKTANLPQVTGAKGARILGAIYQH